MRGCEVWASASTLPADVRCGSEMQTLKMRQVGGLACMCTDAGPFRREGPVIAHAFGDIRKRQTVQVWVTF